MDPAIVDLTARVMGVLLPLVSKSAEEVASKVGDAAFEKMKALLATLKQKWSADKEATDSLIRFEEKPDRYQTVIEDILQEKLAQDHDLAYQLTVMLGEMGPALDIVQHMGEGKDIIGLKAREMRSGSVRISQDIDHAEGVTGAEFETLG